MKQIFIIASFLFLSLISQDKKEDSLARKQIILGLKELLPDLLASEEGTEFLIDTIKNIPKQNTQINSSIINFINSVNIKAPVVSFIERMEALLTHRGFHSDTPLECILKNRECRKIILQGLISIQTNKFEKDKFKKMFSFTIKKLEEGFAKTDEEASFQSLIKNTFTTKELKQMQSSFSFTSFVISAFPLFYFPIKGLRRYPQTTKWWRMVTFQEKLFSFL